MIFIDFLLFFQWFWGPGGSQDEPKTLFKRYFFDVKNCDNFVFILRSILAAKWSPRGTQNASKKRSKNKIGFPSILRRATPGERSRGRASRSRGGGRGRHQSLPLGTWIRIWLGFVAVHWIYMPWGIRKLISLGGFLFIFLSFFNAILDWFLVPFGSLFGLLLASRIGQVPSTCHLKPCLCQKVNFHEPL